MQDNSRRVSVITEESILHNFHILAKPIAYEGKKYISVEHLFQALKFRYPGRNNWTDSFGGKIEYTKTAKEARELGESNFDTKMYQKDYYWEYLKRGAMLFVVHLRFAHDIDAQEDLMKLKGTEIQYVDNSMIWGIGYNGCGANEMESILKEVMQYYLLFKDKISITDKDGTPKEIEMNGYMTENIQTRKFAALRTSRKNLLNDVTTQTRLSDNLNRFVREREAKRIITVVSYGKTFALSCYHQLIRCDNRFKEEVGMDEIPKIEYAYCVNCELRCIIENSNPTVD
jgi:predicted NAD-dependent protein-ADP-ribosyltransferase YbiA (DUF1768 family)